MAMPVLAVEIAFGDAWNVASPRWTDVTEYVRDNPPLRISRGRERVTRPRPGSLTLSLGNNDRRFDPDYSSGPYGDSYEQYLDFGSGTNATRIDMPDDSDSGPTGDLDVAVLIDPTTWNPAGAYNEAWLNKWTETGNQRSFLFRMLSAGTWQLYTATDGSTQVESTSTAATGFSSGTKKWVRVTMDVDDGAGNRVVKFYTADVTSATDFRPGTWTQLGATVTTAGTTSIFNSTALLTMGGYNSGTGNASHGKGYGLLLNNAYDTADLWTSADIKLMIGQTAPASLVGWPNAQTSGGDDSPSQKTWTIRGTVQPTMTLGSLLEEYRLKPMTPIRVRATHNSTTYDLFRGFVSEWRIDTTDGKDSTATVTAVDGLSVLELLKVGGGYESTITADAPVAWWKLDETSGTNANNSGSGGTDGTYQATPTLGVAGPMSGMVAMETVKTSSEYVSVGATAGTDNDTAWTIEGWVYRTLDTGGIFLGMNTSGSTEYWFGYNITYGFGFGCGVTPSYYYFSGSTIPLTTWTHWAVTFTPSNVFALYLNGTLIESATVTAFNNTLFTGTMNTAIGRYSGAATGYTDARHAQVAIYNSALSAGTIAKHAGITFNGFSSGLTSARATAVLDLVGWPSADRTISTGLTTVAAGTQSTTALGTIWEAVDSEDSECYVSGAGKVVFTNRDSRGGSSISATFSNDGSDTPYQGLRWYRDDSLVRTVVAVTDSAGDTLEVTDSTNEAIYGPRTLARTTYTTSATEPTELAYWLLSEYKDALTQVELLLEAGAGTSTAIWAELLSRELGDLVNVEVKPVGGTSQNDWDMFVEQIDLTAAVDFWQTRLGLSNAQGQGTFTLDNAVFGQLDGPGRLGF